MAKATGGTRSIPCPTQHLRTRPTAADRRSATMGDMKRLYLLSPLVLLLGCSQTEPVADPFITRLLRIGIGLVGPQRPVGSGVRPAPFSRPITNEPLANCSSRASRVGFAANVQLRFWRSRLLGDATAWLWGTATPPLLKDSHARHSIIRAGYGERSRTR